VAARCPLASHSLPPALAFIARDGHVAARVRRSPAATSASAGARALKTEAGGGGGGSRVMAGVTAGRHPRQLNLPDEFKQALVRRQLNTLGFWQVRVCA